MNRMGSCGVSCSMPSLSGKAGRGSQVAEADVGQIWAFWQVDLEQHVNCRARRIDGHAPHDPPLQTRDIVAEASQAFAEQHVLFRVFTVRTYRTV
jgi:hypothetical protein